MTIHHMQSGQAACWFPGLPSDWPEDHRWDADWEQVTCPDCLEARDAKEPTEKQKQNQITGGVKRFAALLKQTDIAGFGFVLCVATKDNYTSLLTNMDKEDAQKLLVITYGCIEGRSGCVHSEHLKVE